ncbi:hypothetical protein QCB44_05280 [Thiomicrorhabdus sp. zzn3]|uniref:DUF6962 family protein n=1 Tax=Thiomicrorhabdus sp. zzn3 TaxID=3039775 RepID=UPI002436B5E9|nr:hypothetical protein [Thiomicrorhabdus sp. zzn3]MDG6778112.1 hypothetical protein [Thiomicrorhabdus sp. zzn3]
MEWIDIPTEQTTAVTDALLAMAAAFSALYLKRISQAEPFKIKLWFWVFSLLAAASLLGTSAHGFKLTEAQQTLIWSLLYLALDGVIALFMLAVAYEIWGERMARRFIPLAVGLAIMVFLVHLLRSEFIVFIIYEAVGMVLALFGYIWLALSKRRSGAWYMVAGVSVSLLAAMVQAGKEFTFSFIWPFDHNGVYHVMQMVGVALLWLGLRKSLLLR